MSTHEVKVWRRYSMNMQLEAPDFYISYNPNTNSLGSFFAGDESGEETALVKDGRYLILNGDWREQYEAVFDEGYDACLKFYLQNKDTYRSSWSNDRLDDLLADEEAA